MTAAALAEQAWNEQHAQPHESHAWAQEALARARQEGDAGSEAWALTCIGYYNVRYAGPGEARASLEAAQAAFERLGNARGRLLASNGLARALMLEGELAEALEIFQRNLTVKSEALTTLDRFYTLNGAAGCLSLLGDAPRSLGYLFEALGQLRHINARPQLGTLIANLGSELVAVGDYEEAHRVLREGETIVKDMNNPRLRRVIEANLCECLLQLGRDAEALPYARETMADPETSHMSSVEGSLYPTVALAFLRNGFTEEAAGAVAMALEAARNHDSASGLLHALLVRGMLESRRGDVVAAIDTLADARSRLDGGSPHLVRCQVLEQLAEQLAAAGRHAEAYATQREYLAAYERRLGLASRARYFAVQIRFELDRMRAERDALREQALRDPLTGLYNRRYLDSMLGDLLAMYGRADRPLAVAMLDLDHFKQVNDGYGHPFGDEVLRALAQVLRAGTRAGDVACRYGGEEFCLVFPDARAEDAAARITALQAAFAQVRVCSGGDELGGFAFSAGVADFPACGRTRDELIAAADRALYEAKAAGRACVRSGKMQSSSGSLAQR